MKPWIIVAIMGVGTTGTLFTTVGTDGGFMGGTSQTVGNATYHNYTGSGGYGLTGSSSRVGNTTYTSLYTDGARYSGSSYRIGNTTYLHGYGSNGLGYSGTMTTVGGTTFANIQGRLAHRRRHGNLNMKRRKGPDHVIPIAGTAERRGLSDQGF